MSKNNQTTSYSTTLKHNKNTLYINKARIFIGEKRLYICNIITHSLASAFSIVFLGFFNIYYVAIPILVFFILAQYFLFQVCFKDPGIIPKIDFID